MQNYQLPEGKVLVLRSCRPDMTSKNDFVWPESGHVSAPDWKADKNCGHGLHGWLWGAGDFDLKYKEFGSKWLAVEVDADKIIELNGKVKFPAGNVIVTGTYRQAYDLVKKWFWLRHAEQLKAMEVVDDNATYSNEDNVSVTATKNSGHASAAGYYGHASAAGYYGHASAAGKYGTACVLGLEGKAKCGEDGSIIITYWDDNAQRRRHVIGYAGENGIEAGKWYKLNGKNQLVATTAS